MFVRKKLVKGHVYFQLVENTWANGKVKQRLLLYLGPHSTLQAAHKHWKRELDRETDTERKRRARQMLADIEKYLGQIDK
jgi:hypothetical protein